MREVGGCQGSAVRWKPGQRLLGNGSNGNKTVARLFQSWWGGRGVAGGETRPRSLRNWGGAGLLHGSRKGRKVFRSFAGWVWGILGVAG